jgi:hypothetical protein
MAYPRRGPLHDRLYSAQIVDVSTGDNVSIPIVFDGELVAWSVTLEAVITGTAAFTVEVDGTAHADAAQSLVALAEKTPQTKEVPAGVMLSAGSNLEFITDGGSTNTAIATITAVVRDS